MFWRIDDEWLYETFPLETPASDFTPFQTYIELWRTKRGADVPDWRDFEVADLEGWWGWIAVYDAIADDPLSFRVRLWGTNVARALGYDRTGHILRPADAEEVFDSKHITTSDLLFTRHLLDERLMGRTSGPLDKRFGTQRRYEELWLPLSPDGGATLDKVMLAGRLIETTST